MGSQLPATIRNAQKLPLPDWFKELEQQTRDGVIDFIPYARIQEEAVQYKLKMRDRGVVFTSPDLDVVKIGLDIVDMQLTFCHRRGQLPVKGGEEDSIRAAMFICMYAHLITLIVGSLDTHTVIQIFTALFWVDMFGNHPTGYTQITNSDVRNNVWMVNPAICSKLGKSVEELTDWALWYTEQLEATGKYTLMVWPIHAQLGGISQALMPIVEAAVFWHSCLRQTEALLVNKGVVMKISEMYGSNELEVKLDRSGKAIDTPDYALVIALSEMDYILFFGEAFTHCLWATIVQVVFYFRNNHFDKALKGMRLLRDLTSPVGGFENQIPKIEADLASKGVKVVYSTDSLEKILA